MANINKLFNGRKDAIKFVDGQGSMVLEATIKAVKKELETESLKVKTKQTISLLETSWRNYKQN